MAGLKLPLTLKYRKSIITGFSFNPGATAILAKERFVVREDFELAQFLLNIVYNESSRQVIF